MLVIQILHLQFVIAISNLLLCENTLFKMTTFCTLFVNNKIIDTPEIVFLINEWRTGGALALL